MEFFSGERRDARQRLKSFLPAHTQAPWQPIQAAFTPATLRFA